MLAPWTFRATGPEIIGRQAVAVSSGSSLAGGFTEEARKSLERSRRRVEIIEKKINKVIDRAEASSKASEEAPRVAHDLGSTSFEKIVPCPADVDADCSILSLTERS